MIDGAILEQDEDKVARVMSPLRALKPETDTFAWLAAPGVARIHMDSEQPTASVVRTAGLFDALPQPALDRLLEAAGPDAGTPPLVPIEIRQLGGELSRESPGGGVLDHLEGRFLIASTSAVAGPSRWPRR